MADDLDRFRGDDFANRRALAANWLRTANHIVVFSGAGISAESGIPTFRDDDGFWQRFPPEQFATWRGLLFTFFGSPRRLAEFLDEVIRPIAFAEPNAAHEAIARLDQFVRTTVVTQNVDNLHRAAGSTTVHEIHGTFFEQCSWRGRFIRYLTTRQLRQAAELARRARSGLARLRLVRAVRSLAGISWRGVYRPRLVLFGDGMAEPDWSDARRAAAECDVMLVVGTSGLVLPAAMLPALARESGARVIVVDPADAGTCDVWIRGSATVELPVLIQSAFGESHGSE